MPWIVLLTSLAVTFFAWHLARNVVLERANDRFVFRTQSIELALHERLHAYAFILQSGAGLFAGSDEVTRAKWRTYVTALQIDKHYPGVQGLGFSKKILPAEKDALIRQMREQGFPDYDIHPEGKRPVYTSIIFLEPFDRRNQRAFGYDMFSEPTRKEAMVMARDTGSAAMSGKITLLQETEKDVQAGFLMYLPVYRNGAVSDTPEQRREALIGYVYSPFRMNDFMRGLLKEKRGYVELQIFDGDKPLKEALLYPSGNMESLLSRSDYVHFATYQSILEYAGHRWLLVFKSSPYFEGTIDTAQVNSILLLGSIISLLLFFVVLSLTKSRNQALSLADIGFSLTEAQRIAHLGNWEWDVINNTLSWSDEIYRIFGLDPQQFGASYEDFLNAVHPEDRPLVDDTVREALARQHTYSIEHRILQPDGTLRYVHEQAEIIRGKDGQPISLLGTVQDITERKLAEEHLRKQQTITSQIIETIPMRVFWKDRALNYLGCNTAFARDAGGNSPDEMLGKNDSQMGWKGQAELYRADDQRVMDTDTPKLSYDEPQTTPSGEQIWLRTSKVPLHNAANEVIGMLGVYEDITESKRMELKFLESEQRLRNLTELTTDGVWQVDEHGTYVYSGAKIKDLLGYDPEEVVGKTPFDFMPPEEAARVAEIFQDIASKQKPFSFVENINLHKDGHKVILETSGVPLVADDGTFHGFFGTERDITQRKQAEQTIMDERNFSDTLIASQPDVFYVLDQTGLFIRWNKKMQEILRLSDAELAVTNALDVIHEADRPMVAKKIQEAFEQGAATIEARLITKMGIRDYVFSATSADTAKGKHLVGVGTDITERKQMETELRESEHAYRTLSQNLPGMVYRVHLRESGRMQFYNDMPTQITGYAADELTTGKVCSIEPMILDEDRPGVEAEVMRAIAEKRAFAVEYRLKHKDGGIRWLAEHGMPVYDEDGATLYIDGVIFDITEHKQDEIKLQLFRTLIDNSSDAIEVLDPATLRLLDVNETECLELGYSREELMSMKILDIDVGFTTEQMKEIQAQIIQKGEARFESVHRRKDGSTFPVEISAKQIEIDKPYLLSIVRDITERKLAEVELKKLQEQLREQAVHDPLTGLYNRRYLEESMGREIIRAERNGQPIGIVMCDLDHFKRVNDTYGHLVGDEVLKVFAELLLTNSRGSDIVCRFGGEEFLLLLPDMPQDVAYQRAEELRVLLAAQPIGKSAIQVTASFGVATFPVDGETLDALISAADAAMYQAKDTGRNRVVVASAREYVVSDRTEMDSTEVSGRKDERRTDEH